MASGVKVAWNDRAFMDLAKSPGVHAAVKEATDAMCAAANMAAASHAEALHAGSFEYDPYTSRTAILDRSALGVVSTNTRLGAADQARFKTLDSFNH